MADDLHIFPDEFVPNVQASLTYKRWAKSSPGDRGRWEAFRDALLAGQEPSVPSMATTFGRALVAAGKEHMSISRFVGTPTNPYPPPDPVPGPQGYYYDHRWDSGTPAGWAEARQTLGETGDISKITIAYPADPFGTGEGSVLRLRDEYDPTMTTQNVPPGAGGPRQLGSVYNGFSDNTAHAGFNATSEETWYRLRLAFPSGTIFSGGQWHFLFEWHTDNNTQSATNPQGQAGNSPGLSIEGDYPLSASGSTNPGLCLVWRSGDVVNGVLSNLVETYWPNSNPSTGAFSTWQRQAILYDHWYDFVWHVIWSSNASTGLMEWWKDGALVVSRTMATRYSNNALPHGQSNHAIGVYNYRYNTTATSDVYCSQLTVGPTAASVGFVVP